MKFFEKYLSLDKKHICYKLCGLKFSAKNRQYDLYNDFTKVKEQVDFLHNLLNYTIDITKIPPAKGKLREQQLEAFSLLKKIHKICEENNLRYWLDYGSLLGAVRHKGFIPWDDDVDIAMLREDAYKCIPLLKEYFKNTDYYIRENLENHFQIRIERNDNADVGLDIFILDKHCLSGELSEELETEINNKIRLATSELAKKVKEDDNFAQDINAVRDAIKVIQDEIILQGKIPAENKPILFHAIDYPYICKHLCHTWDEIFPLSTVEFEGEFFCAPNDSHKYLVREFSKDYMKFPKSIKSCNDQI